MCRGLMFPRRACARRTFINIITTVATPTFRALRNRTSEELLFSSQSYGSGAFHELNPQAQFLWNWHIEVLAAKLRASDRRAQGPARPPPQPPDRASACSK